MMTAFILLLHLTVQSRDFAHVDALLADEGYATIREDRRYNGNEVLKSYHRGSDHSSFLIQRSVISVPVKTFMDALLQTNGQLPKGSLSGMPLADFTLHDEDQEALYLHAVAGQSHVLVRFKCGTSDAALRASLKKKETPLVEGIARNMISELLEEGHDSSLSADASASAVSLDDLKLSKHWSYQVDERSAVATIQAGGKTVIAPLASRQVSINGKWVDIGGYVLRFQDQFMLPQSAVQAISSSKG